MSSIYELPSGVRTVAKTGPTALPAALAQLDERLRSSGFDVDALFRPGLPGHLVRRMFDEVGLTPSDELVALYEWRDGHTAAGFTAQPLANLVMAPLHLVLARYADREALIGTPLEITVPLVILDADDRGHAVLCDGPPDEPPIILEFTEENGVHDRSEPVGRSICTWITSWTLAIDMGYWMPSGTPSNPFWTYDASRMDEYDASLALP